MAEQLILEKEFAEIREVKLTTENKGCLRVYRRSCNASLEPDSFMFQIRTFKPITEYGNGKSRNMIAGVELNIPEVEALLEYMKACQNED